MYIRKTPNNSEVKEIADSVRNCDLVIGDLNLNPRIPDQRSKLLNLCGNTKQHYWMMSFLK